MKHTADDTEVKTLAALYALDALAQDEADAFREHLAEGCEACASELEEFEKVADALALAPPAVAPPPVLRERLLASLSPATNEPELLIIRAEEGEWMETPDEGVFVKILFVDKERSLVTSLLRMTPGSRITTHRHRGIEQCLVVEGDLRFGGMVLQAGDYNCATPGSVHRELTTLKGNLLLIVEPENNKVIEHNNNNTPPQP